MVRHISERDEGLAIAEHLRRRRLLAQDTARSEFARARANSDAVDPAG